MTQTPIPVERDSNQAMLRGMCNRCPNCGEGRVFAGYLKLVDACSVCGERIGSYRAADGPAFFTITIIMLLLIPMIAAAWVWFRLSPLMILIVLSVMTTVMTLILLRYVKGAFIGWLWAKNERDPGA
ncbi:DUF983 domain-containing protein [Paracoccus sp. (in: a-proteobacteria)]|uniref:DUF983 domain-containing protein n=1 Tax=Paracoccus sp. TaxID=267 RepID=UPI00289F45C7|nr:DUF983 domain-containing protein [Paracoccus sp. (in: a-proteobacteria)]